MTGRYFSKDQKRRARQADLYNFLLAVHPNDYMVEGDSIRPRFNHSISIRRGYSGYLDFATGEKGNCLDYLQRYHNYTFTDAVIALLGNSYVPTDPPEAEKETKPVTFTGKPEFPPPAQRYSRATAYLCRSRYISPQLVSSLISQHLIYQDAEHNNVVFINRAQDWGEQHGTVTYIENRCKNRLYCGDKYNPDSHGCCLSLLNCSHAKRDSRHYMVKGSRENGFWYFQLGDGAQPRTAFICEGAIDAMSLCDLHGQELQKQYGGTLYFVSIGGVSKQPAIDRIKKQMPSVLAVDNDPKGDARREKNAELPSLRPKFIDWNEDLIKARRGRSV